MTLRILSAAVLATGLILAVAATAFPVTPETGRSGLRSATCPGGDEDGYKVRKLVGKAILKARQVARRNDCTIRVVKRHGKGLPVTDDFVPNRINVFVRDRRVTHVRGVF